MKQASFKINETKTCVKKEELNHNDKKQNDNNDKKQNDNNEKNSNLITSFKPKKLVENIYYFN
jgi:hypothetical protein